jgi:hypothetical protein
MAARTVNLAPPCQLLLRQAKIHEG